MDWDWDWSRSYGQNLIVGAASYCLHAGQKKCHAAYYAKRMDERIEEFVMREELIMLTAAELDVENCRPTNFPEPRRVDARVRYPSNAIRVQAHGILHPHSWEDSVPRTVDQDSA
ncbi:hypothetical protein [uncultured Arthrobacter sp.]|uniref:hypothetical protein n=1 Tax=uncultured Arthrobacter sp. TaxID=114050 RepID=UPI0025D73F72|nr:hypothetical protein [uncultured Arthrobacter sp.]